MKRIETLRDLFKKTGKVITISLNEYFVYNNFILLAK